MNREDFLVHTIEQNLALSTGCTEPVAIALNCATAAGAVAGRIEKVSIRMDIGLFKNASGVGVPGTDRRGVKVCAAIGLGLGDPRRGMNLLGDLTREDLRRADRYYPMIELEVLENIRQLFVETTLETNCDCVRVTTYAAHDNIISVQYPPFEPVDLEECAAPRELRDVSLAEMRRFADTVPLGKIEFLEAGQRCNRAIAMEGLKQGYGKSLGVLREKGRYGDSAVDYVRLLTGSASYARMTGVRMPVMAATGSGNQGLTLSLTIEAVAEKLGVPREKKLRALALAHLVNIHAKSYFGALTAICACGVASAPAASAGIVYLLDGPEERMLGAMRNVLGGITGMICDGAKEGCAYKVAMSAASAALAAFLADESTCLLPEIGILGTGMESLFANVAYLVECGMTNANRVIVDIMERRDVSAGSM